MSTFFEEGNLVTISAAMGCGKTDFSLLLTYIAMKQGCRVLGNIELDVEKSIVAIARFENLNVIHDRKKIIKFLSNYVIIHNDVELLKECIKHKKNLIILDEANLFSTSKRAMTIDAVTFELIISCIRKFYASMILVIQRYANFLPMVRELSFLNISKVSKPVAILEIFPINKVATLENIPKSPICFQTHGFSGMDFLINWYRLVSDLKNLSDEEALKFLRKHARNNFLNYLNYG